MAISNKLNYLIETKSKFKDRLNSLGAEIIESTTFRNYLNWLDTFYGEVSDKTDLSENGIVGRTGQNPTLPTDYTRVDYIESSGTQYIDTSVNADNKLRVALDMQYTDLSNVNNTNCGAIRSGIPNIRYHLMSQGGKFRFYTMDGGIDLLNSDTNRHTFDLDVPNNIITVDSTQVEKISTAFDVQLNFWLFGRNSNNDSYKFYNSSKLYFCQMYYNNELVRDFIPCYRNSDNVVGLYDLVNDVFYTNAGTGAFTYGAIVTEPNPDCPLEIKNLSGDVEYKVRGKNLFDKDTIINGYVNAGGGITNLDGYKSSAYIEIKPNASYYKSQSGSTRWKYYDENKNVYSSETTDLSNASNEQIFITPSNVKYLRFTMSNDLVDSFILCEGTTATPYEPYISESFPLSLGDIELCKIGDYQDSIVKDNGKWFLHKEIGKVVFDGSESWAINTSYTYNVFYRTLGDYARISNTQTTYCEYYKGIENAGGIAAFGNNYNNSIGVRTANDNIKDIYISNNSITSASDFKTWLSTHNTVVYYVLATPTTTEITEENYPTLYSQLLAIQEFLTKYKINKEFLLDYSSPEIEY